MASTKEYNVKLTGLKNTKKITKTMKMVSASKLRRAQDSQRSAQEYALGLAGLIERLSTAVSTNSHPLLTIKKEYGKILIILFTSDRGLCGGFNNNLCKFLFQWIKDHGKEYSSISLSFCGRKGQAFFSKNFTSEKYYEHITEKPDFYSGITVGEDTRDYFLSDKYDEIYLVYNTFKSALSQTPIIKKLLPIDPQEFSQTKSLSTDYIFEPNKPQLLQKLLPRWIDFKLYYTLLENSAGEHGARMTAMENATKNADELIDKYTLLRNRARQSSITTELTEIVAGAETL